MEFISVFRHKQTGRPDGQEVPVDFWEALATHYGAKLDFNKDNPMTTVVLHPRSWFFLGIQNAPRTTMVHNVRKGLTHKPGQLVLMRVAGDQR